MKRPTDAHFLTSAKSDGRKERMGAHSKTIRGHYSQGWVIYAFRVVLPSSSKVYMAMILLRGLPYTMSAQKGEGVKKWSKFAHNLCGQRGGRGSKNSENYVDVTYGSPLGGFHI